MSDCRGVARIQRPEKSVYPERRLRPSRGEYDLRSLRPLQAQLVGLKYNTIAAPAAVIRNPTYNNGFGAALGGCTAIV